MTIMSARINTLARLRGAMTYLEIGVSMGATFNAVKIGHNTAVDPDFQFDISKYRSPDTFFFSVTSDKFFEDMENIQKNIYCSDAGGEVKYDIIFLDGLHTYKQVMRDFTNSLPFSHTSTIWIFDDTVPYDIFAAIPNQKDCYMVRQFAGFSGKAWMGDVFKVVFILHDFYHEFSYATIYDNCFSQNVVWRTAKLQMWERIFNNPDDIYTRRIMIC